MAEVYLARTNQKLTFARLHLEALANAQASSGWSKHALIESYQESILFHLMSAYVSLLREIAERYRVNAQSIKEIHALQQAFDAAGFESPELSELIALQENPASWLHKLHNAYEACWLATDKAKVASAETSLSEIQVMQVNPDHSEDSGVYQEYASWLTEFRTLIERQRAGMQEW